MAKGRYGIHGGQYIPEILMNEVNKLEEAYKFFKKDPEFNREDLNHTGSHKINNVLGQALLARKMGKTRIIAETGAALIEIGIPFYDLIAEGPVIQEANVRALSAPGGCSTDQVFDMVERARGKVFVPLVFLTYLNPVFKYGYQAFYRRCAETGISGLIIPDLPVEEREELEPAAEKFGVELISLIAPTSQERIQLIGGKARGYIYLVSSMGVTGVWQKITTNLEEIIAHIRQVTDTPVAIGFGISTPEQACQYSKIADGVIVGSAIVKLIAEHGEHAVGAIEEYVESMVKGCGKAAGES